MANLPIPANVRQLKRYKKRRITSSEDYKVLYRFTEENLDWIVKEFLHDGKETRGGALTPKLKMQVFLRYISDPGFQSGVAHDVGVDQTTVSKTVQQARTFKLTITRKFSNAYLQFFFNKNFNSYYKILGVGCNNQKK